jgi:hypothetical protein
MKKFLFLLISIAFGYVGMAQTEQIGSANNYRGSAKLADGGRNNISLLDKSKQSGLAAKTTGLSDTLEYLSNNDTLLFDSSLAYTLGSNTDSGYIFGTNALGIMGFAEFFNFPFSSDTTLQILGVLSYWHGTISATSAKTISFKLWYTDTTDLIPDILYNSQVGVTDSITWLPGATASYSQSVSILNLGIGTSGGPDTPYVTYFPTPWTNIGASFDLGYEINYQFSALNGDTIGVRTTPQGDGNPNTIGYYGIDTYNDTVHFASNCAETSPGVWQDLFWDFGYMVDYSIVPIIQFNSANITSVKGVTKNNLTFYGNYPNPATTNTNIKFALQNGADVTIDVMDLAGRIINSIQQPGLLAGEHIINISTSNLINGNYVYVVRTNGGDALAGQMSVNK